MKDIQLYSYRIQIKHKLTPADIEFLVSVINHYHINRLVASILKYPVYLHFLCGFLRGFEHSYSSIQTAYK